MSKCRICGGSGICKMCKGTGSSKKMIPHPSDNLTNSETGAVSCIDCGGRTFCTACDGKGEEK